MCVIYLQTFMRLITINRFDGTTFNRELHLRLKLKISHLFSIPTV